MQERLVVTIMEYILLFQQRHPHRSNIIQNQQSPQIHQIPQRGINNTNQQIILHTNQHQSQHLQPLSQKLPQQVILQFYI